MRRWTAICGFYNHELPNPSSISSFTQLKKINKQKSNLLFVIYIYFIATGVFNRFTPRDKRPLILRCTCAFLHILYLVFQSNSDFYF